MTAAKLITFPGGREPGGDDDVANDDEEGELITVGTTIWDVALNQAREDLAQHAMGTAVARIEKPLFEPTKALIGQNLPRTSWLLRGLLTEASVACIGGEPKSTKTWAGLEMLLSVATGTKAFGEFHAGRPRHVAAFLVEDNPQSFRNRLFALAHGRRMPVEKATERIHHRCLTALDLRSPADLALLVASIRALPEPPAVVMLDPLRDLIGDADENSASEMSAVMHGLRALRNTTGATPLLVHHSGKATKDSGARRGGQKLRGSSAIHGALDCGLYLQDTRGNMRTNWKNKAEVEIKGAKGAGVFGLELDVQDDSEGAAKVAGWRFYEDPAEMDPPDQGG